MLGKINRICIVAGLGAGIGTGRRVVRCHSQPFHPCLPSQLAYEAAGISLCFRAFCAGLLPAYTYGKLQNLDVKTNSRVLISVP